MGLRARHTYFVGARTVESLQLDEEEFFDVIEDETVKHILEDLDVSMFNSASMYDTFDPDGTGVITVADLVQAVMKLRGEPQKNDMIASWVALRALHEKFDQFQTSLLLQESTKLGSRPASVLPVVEEGSQEPPHP